MLKFFAALSLLKWFI